jgi:hypothetical protein
MKVSALVLIGALWASPALAQASQQPIAESVSKAVKAAASAPESQPGRRKLFWPGLALGIAGVSTSVVAATVARVDNNSTGNAPSAAYQACVAQKRDPIYAGNNCDALKAKNVKLLAAGVAMGAAGGALVIAGSRTSADLGSGVIRLLYRIRF